MWLLIVGVIALVFIIAVIAEALGYNMTTNTDAYKQNYMREQDELTNRWFTGNHLPDDEEKMFDNFYEGDIDNPDWN